jgi:hypothetical protein
MSIVKLSKKTQNILKNFATINKSIVISPGNKLRTMSVNRNIFASVEIAEDIPQEVAIYDLGVFLAGLSLFENPMFSFDSDKKLEIRDETSKATTSFYYCDPEIITKPPQKDIEMPQTDVVFNLKTDTLQDLLRAASVYQVPDLCLYSGNGNINLMVCDKKNETSNTYSVPVGKLDDEDQEFCYCFKVENIRILPGDYTVSVAKNKVSHFVSESNNLEYYIALEPDSK